MICAEDIARALHGRRSLNQWVCRCPAHDDRRPSLAVRDGDDGRVLLHCHAGCGPLDIIDALKALGLWETQEHTCAPSKPKPPAKPATDNRGKARWLWQRSQPIMGTAAELYMRRRGISCPLPATLRFLPGNDRYPPGMIAPFVVPDEPEVGLLSVNADDVDAVHIIRLTPDGHSIPMNPSRGQSAQDLACPSSSLR
jgi:hypothetical protein